MAIQTAIKVEGGVDVANCYVRIHDINLKKDRTSTSSDKHYVSYGVSVYRNASDAGNDPAQTQRRTCRHCATTTLKRRSWQRGGKPTRER